MRLSLLEPIKEENSIILQNSLLMRESNDGKINCV